MNAPRIIRKAGHPVFRPDFTDVMIYMGLTHGEALQDLDDLFHYLPEETLGYQIRTMTPDTAPMRVLGLHVTKVVFNIRCTQHERYREAMDVLRMALLPTSDFGKIEIFLPRAGKVVPYE